jgi:hypothetical protein
MAFEYKFFRKHIFCAGGAFYIRTPIASHTFSRFQNQ